ncbi:uncharacterized protein LOC141831159 [Curcuma longa]|uniref:uncharacterized protein LOC141831159 n=1 Tax=Curcuma longa TaxID=136217 RepID=UPI003D9EAF28
MDDYKPRCEQEDPPEDRLTSLHDDLLISILSFLPIKQRVAVSAVCTRFNRLLPSIPRLDTIRLEVGLPSGGSDNRRDFTFPCALIRQFRVVFHDDVADLHKPLEQVLVDYVAESGVQDLILELSGNGWLNLRGGDCGVFGIKSLRSLSLDRIRVSKDSDDRRPLSPLGCALLASLKMEFCVLSHDFLINLLASCPFLETLRLLFCYRLRMDSLCIHSASIKHLALLCMIPAIGAIDIRGPKLESLAVDVVNKLHIEAPKVRHASFLLAVHPPTDPPGALRKLFGAALPRGVAWLLLNSCKPPNIFAAENGIDKFISPYYNEDTIIFNLDFNLKVQSSTMMLTEFLKKCNDGNTEFDISADSTHIESTIEDAHLLLHGSTEVELIDLQMRMPDKTFEEFLLNQKEMTEELKEMGLQMLRSRTSREQFKNILESEVSLFQVSSSVPNCIEMKF